MPRVLKLPAIILTFAACAIFGLYATSASAVPTIKNLHYFTNSTTDGKYPVYGDLVLYSGKLYGMTPEGGSGGLGTIFSMNTDGTGFTILHNFAGGSSDGSKPYGSLLLSGSTFYGMTSAGGSGNGVIFSMTPTGTFTRLYSFTGTTNATTGGGAPYGSLITNGTTLYGMTYSGGSSNFGTVFSLVISTKAYKVLHNFTGATTGTLGGKYPFGSLTISGTTLWGMTKQGGSSNLGTIFSLTTSGTGFSVKHSFVREANDGGTPYGSLILSGTTLYGMTYDGGIAGTYGNGVIFSMTTSGTFTKLFSFDGLNGQNPYGSLVLSNNNLYGFTYAGGMSGGGIGNIFSYDLGTGAINSVPMTASTINGTYYPKGSPIISGTTIYGMSTKGGSSNYFSSNYGNIFSISTDMTAPITTASATNSNGTAYVFGTYTNSSTVTVTLSCSDPGGVGCSFTSWCTGATCTPTTTYTGSITISAPTSGEGAIYLRYSSTDSEGNKEDAKTQVINIDTVPPTMSVLAQTMDILSGGGGWANYTFDTWTNSRVRIFIDLLSANSSVYYCIDNGAYDCTDFATSGGDAEVYFTATGYRRLKYYATDLAGNTSGIVTKIIKVDMTPPTTSASAVTDTGNSYTFGASASKAVTVTIACADQHSGCKNIYYCVGTSSCVPNNVLNTSGVISVSVAGTRYLKYRAVDNAGGESCSLSTSNCPSQKIVITDGIDSLGYINHATGFYNELYIPVTYSIPADGGGIFKSLTTKIQRASAELICNSNNITECGIFGDFLDLAAGSALPSLYSGTYTDTTIEDNHCYRYRLSVDHTSVGSWTSDSGFTTEVDASAPTGSISYPNGYVGSSFALSYTLSAGSGSCFKWGYAKTQVSLATLSNDVCGSFGSFADLIGASLSAADLTAGSGSKTISGLAADKCYKYRISVYDQAENNAIFTSNNIIKGSGTITEPPPQEGVPVTTASATKPDGTPYVFGTCTGPLAVNLTCSSTTQCSTYYCTDATNTCAPAKTYSGGVNMSADVYSSLHDFNVSDGKAPYGSLIASAGGLTFYGMTRDGGSSSKGVIFSVSSSGQNYRVLYNFTGATNSGANPYGSLVLSTDGSTLYGMTKDGGANNLGIVFSISISGTNFTILHSFTGLSDGSNPYGSLILSGSTLYGMTKGSGSGGNYGTVFSVSTTGTNYKRLKEFTGRVISDSTAERAQDGMYPYGSLLLYNGKLYGMTAGGGGSSYTDSDGNDRINVPGSGIIFSIATNGTGFDFVYRFTTSSGGFYSPFGSLMLLGSKFYGMTRGDGVSTSSHGFLFSISTSGQNFSVLHSFESEWSTPCGSLAFSNATLYGMTRSGGTSGKGFIFSFDTAGYIYKVLYNITSGDPESNAPMGSPLIINNSIYGLDASSGGAGKIFELLTSDVRYIRYYSTNTSGTEATKSASVKIDGSGPVTTISAKKSDGAAYNFGEMTNKKVTVTFSCSDATTGSCAAGCSKTYYCIDSDNTCDPNIEYPTTSSGIGITSGGALYIRYASTDLSGNKEAVASKAIIINNHAFFGTKVIKATSTSGNYWCLPGATGASYPGTQISILAGDGCDVANNGASDNGKCQLLTTIEGSGTANPPEMGPTNPLCPGGSIPLWTALTNLVPSTKYVIKLTTNTYCPGIYSSFAGNKACWVVPVTNKSCTEICSKYGLTPTTSGTTCYNNAFNDIKCSLIEKLKGSACKTCNSVASNGYNYFDKNDNCYYTYQAGWSNKCSALGADFARLCSCEADNSSDNFYFSFTTPSSL